MSIDASPRYDNPVPLDSDDDIMPLMAGEGLLESSESFLSALQEQLTSEGEPIDPGWLRRQFGDDRIVEGLAKVEAQSGVPAREYVRHSYRYAWLKPDAFMTQPAAESHWGGLYLDLNAVRAHNVDPSKVLYYRVTQPSAHPKPEYFWTSDSLEVRRGLQNELGNGETTAIILASTLETIDANGGLMSDVNDDEGVAVEQVGRANFDQRQALFAFGRPHDSVGTLATETLQSDRVEAPLPPPQIPPQGDAHDTPPLPIDDIW